MTQTVLKQPTLVKTRRHLREALAQLRRDGRTVGLVPTMGALHQGHLSLVRASVRACEATVVTIFVNPTQFAPGEDFEKYPRSLDADVEKLAAEGADLVFAPDARAIYRGGHSTFVEPPAVAAALEGKCRPGHFRGVCTVVLKLFHLIPADVAFFGRKDYQQSLVIRRMVEDFDLPIQIRVCPTVREVDGLAMSSRNEYLSPVERRRALAISQALQKAKNLRAAGEHDAQRVLDDMRQILNDAGITRIDYVALADPETLENRPTLDEPCVALIAAYVGKTRLIDNLPLG